MNNDEDNKQARSIIFEKWGGQTHPKTLEKQKKATFQNLLGVEYL